SLTKGRRKKGDLKVGIGAKMLWRRGGYRGINYLTLFRLSEGRSLLASLIGSWGQGYGVDAGVHYSRLLSKKVTWGIGSSFTEIGDVSFGNTGADPQKGNFGIGTSIRYEPSWLFTVVLAYDYQNILTALDWRLRNHLGLELKFPFVDAY